MNATEHKRMHLTLILDAPQELGIVPRPFAPDHRPTNDGPNRKETSMDVHVSKALAGRTP